MARYFIILFFFNIYAGNKITEDQILKYRLYLKETGYGDILGNLELLKFILQLKEIDYDDQFNIEFILKANYPTNKYDLVSLNLPEIIKCCNHIFDSQHKSTLLPILIEHMPKFSNYKNALKFLYNRDKIKIINKTYNDKLLSQAKLKILKFTYKDLLEKYTIIVGQFILRIAIEEYNFITTILYVLGDNLKFVKKIYEKIYDALDDTIKVYCHKEDLLGVKILIETKQELDLLFKNKIKMLKFKPKNNIHLKYEEIKDKETLGDFNENIEIASLFDN